MSNHNINYKENKIFSYLEEMSDKLFDIREGERVRVFLMTLYIFLVISSLMIIKPTCTSLFLSKFTASHLPYVFILVAVFASLVASLYSGLLKRISLISLIVKTLQISILSLLAFRVLLSIDVLQGLTLYIFYVWSAIFALISASQFWILVNIIFNPRDAKRLIGFIGSGAIAGGITGGYLTKIFALYLGSKNMIFICILFLFACIYIARRLASGTKQDEKLQKFRQQQHAETVIDQPLTIILNSRHLLLLAGIIGLSVMVGKLVEFQFSAIASSSIPDEDQLTAFFGFWFSNLNIVSLLIQLFLTRRIVGVLGVGTSLFFLPIGILLSALIILISPSLWSAIMIKMTDGSLKNSLNKAGLELLALPIPVNIKTQAKTFIDVFVDSFATGMGGLLLLFVTVLLGFTTQKVSLIIILFVFFWLYLANKIRYEYIRSFRIKLEDSPSPIPKSDIVRTEGSILDGLINALQEEDGNKILKALEMIGEIRNERLAFYLEKLLHHPLNTIRLEALKNLYLYRGRNLIEQVEALVLDPDQDIKAEAIRYLFRHSGRDRNAVLQQYLGHEEDSIRRAAFVVLAQESRNNRKLAETFRLRETIENTLKRIAQIEDEQEAVLIKINCARVIGAANIMELHSYLHILLNDKSEDVVRAAILGAGETRQTEFIPILIRLLGVIEFKEVVVKALTGFSPQITDILQDHLKNSFVSRSIRLGIPAVMSLIGTQKSVNILLQNLEQRDPALRYEIIKALNRLRANFPFLKFESKNVVKMIVDEVRDYLGILSALYAQVGNHSKPVNPSNTTFVDEVSQAREALIKKVEGRLDYNLERIFRLLGLKYPPRDIYDAYLGLRSSEPDLRINAVEYLDSALEMNLRKSIIPIIETPTAATMIDKTVAQLDLEVPSEFEGLVILLNREDKSLQISALNLIAYLKDEKYIPVISRLVNHPDRDIRDRTGFALKNLGITL